MSIYFNSYYGYIIPNFQQKLQDMLKVKKKIEKNERQSKEQNQIQIYKCWNDQTMIKC